MRASANADGTFVKAYAGSTGVLVAFDVDPARRQGLLGFALQRGEGRTGAMKWLKGMLHFPGVPRAAGQRFPTNEAPIQKFRWSDYGVYPGRTYRYTVHPVYGSPGRLDVQHGPTVTVRTAAISRGSHAILFNRAAAASQAFSRDFPHVEQALDAARKAGLPPPPLPPDALAWLSRGVDDEIVRFIDRAADSTWAVDIAIYEYELECVVAAVNAAHRRGAHVRVVFHARKGDPQTAENEHSLAGLPDALKRPRLTSKICHDKFIVLSRLGAKARRRPVAVLCGSTNFTSNGVYRQANALHIVRDPKVASRYEEVFEELFSGADTRATRQFISESNPMDLGASVFTGFSPRKGRADLISFTEMVAAARRDVLFCTAFAIDEPLLEALLGTPNDAILRFGLQNTKSRITAFHRDRTARFVAAAMLSKGLEGFLKESLAGQRGNLFIHTKLLVVDFTSDAPVVISGSHNLSVSASEGNDENFLILRGDIDVADCYGIELMRLYDHYRFRFATRTTTTTAAPGLTEDDSWTDRYFRAGSLNQRDRLAFAGRG